MIAQFRTKFTTPLSADIARVHYSVSVKKLRMQEGTDG